MQVRRFDIYRARIQFGKCADPRPVLILRDPVSDPAAPKSALVLVAPLSSQWDLFNASTHFEINDQDPAFGATGLKRKSYIIASTPALVPVDRLEKRCGSLTGDLLQRFLFWLPNPPAGRRP